jgi:type VI secretion system protein ImpB
MAIQDEIPKSRITLRYRTEINGAPADIELPYRLLVLGDFSKGSSKDRKDDLRERKLRSMDGSNTDAVMADMDISLKLNVANLIDEAGGDLPVELPFKKIRSFSPDEVAKNVPKLKFLLSIKELLEEVTAEADNRSEFRALLDEVVSHPEIYQETVADLLQYKFDSLRLPSPAEANSAADAASSGNPNSSDPSAPVGG